MGGFSREEVVALYRRGGGKGVSSETGREQIREVVEECISVG